MQNTVLYIHTYIRDKLSPLVVKVGSQFQSSDHSLCVSDSVTLECSTQQVSTGAGGEGEGGGGSDE